MRGKISKENKHRGNSQTTNLSHSSSSSIVWCVQINCMEINEQISHWKQGRLFAEQMK